VKKLGILVAAILVLSLAVGTLFGGCTTESPSNLKVVTSTSLLTQIVQRVGGDKVDVVNIIPPAQCPGHFDAKPSDIQKLADADLFLLHGWQGEKFSQDLIASAGNPDLTVTQVNAKVGENTNWMTPSVQQAATDKVASALAQLDTGNSSYYQKSATDYKDMVAAKEAVIRARTAQANLPSVNVMCADMQTGFVKWVGFNLITTFGRPDSLTPQVVKELVDKGKAQNVSLIIDNMQSGQDAGAGIAEELGCTRIILTNFPGGFENTETWEKAIDRNIELIMAAVAR